MRDKDLKILIKAAHTGGEVLRRYFGQVMDLVEKSTVADFQTKADLESEKVILEILKKEFPTYNILSEEEGKTHNGSDYTFIIDPLDGTNNFVLGMAHFSVSIALLYRNEAIMGVVYQPITNQTYSAIRGTGAFLDGKRITVNDISETKKLTIIYVCGYKVYRDYFGKIMNALGGGNCKRIINNWSAAFECCMLASGKVESIVMDDPELHDFAAGKLIAIEAGAQVIDFNGGKEKDYSNNKFIMSNTNKVNEYILSIVKPLQKNQS